jgi:hypothetical protein
LHALVIDRDGTDLRRGGTDFETFLAIEQCRDAKAGYGIPDSCACSVSHCLGLRAVRSIGKEMVPLSWRYAPVFRIYFSRQQRQS